MSASDVRVRLRAVFFVTLAVGVALLAACGSGDDDSDSAEQVDARPRGTVTAQSAVETVESFNPAEEDAVASLNEVIYAGGDFVPTLEPLLNDDDPNVQWAALYVISALTDTEEEIAVLEPVLEDDDEIFAVMAAGSLAGLGVVDALPVLIDGLSSDAELPYSDPPQPLMDHARLTLEHYTGESFDDAASWGAWWDDVGADLTFVDGNYVSD